MKMDSKYIIVRFHNKTRMKIPCMCVPVCMYVCVCVHINVSLSACVCTYIWKPDVDIMCLLWMPSTLF